MSASTETKSRMTPRNSAGDADSPETAAKREAWLLENKAAIEAWNAYYETHGLILDAYRQF